MGAIKNYLHEWLENWGHELGYDMSNVPDLGDLDAIVESKIDAKTYWENR